MYGWHLAFFLISVVCWRGCAAVFKVLIGFHLVLLSLSQPLMHTDSACTAVSRPSVLMSLCLPLPACLVNIAVPGLGMPVLISSDWHWGDSLPIVFSEGARRVCERGSLRTRRLTFWRVLPFFRTPPGDGWPGGVRGGGFRIQRARKPGKQQQHTRHR